MNDATAKVWHAAEAAKIGTQYTAATRNPDKAVRDQFKIDRDTVGTRAWGICECMKLANPSVELSDEQADAILAAIA